MMLIVGEGTIHHGTFTIKSIGEVKCGAVIFILRRQYYIFLLLIVSSSEPAGTI